MHTYNDRENKNYYFIFDGLNWTIMNVLMLGYKRCMYTVSRAREKFDCH